MTTEAEKKADEWVSKNCEHFPGDYAASDCTYESPRYPGDEFTATLKGAAGFNQCLKEAYLAGWDAAIARAPENPEQLKYQNQRGSDGHES